MAVSTFRGGAIFTDHHTIMDSQDLPVMETVFNNNPK